MLMHPVLSCSKPVLSQRAPALANFFTPLVNNIEQMFLSGRATYPVERTLAGLVIAGVDSLHQEQARVMIPHLDIPYQPTAESTFWRN